MYVLGYDLIFTYVNYYVLLHIIRLSIIHHYTITYYYYSCVLFMGLKLQQPGDSAIKLITQPGELLLNPKQPSGAWRWVGSSPVDLYENPKQPGDSSSKFISVSVFPVKVIPARWKFQKVHNSPVKFQ